MIRRMIPIKEMKTIKMIHGLMMKEVNLQIYQILDEKGNTSSFENRVREFSGIGCFLAPRKNFELTTKEVKSCLFDSKDSWINDERGESSDLPDSR